MTGDGVKFRSCSGAMDGPISNRRRLLPSYQLQPLGVVMTAQRFGEAHSFLATSTRAADLFEARKPLIRITNFLEKYSI